MLLWERSEENKQPDNTKVHYINCLHDVSPVEMALITT